MQHDVPVPVPNAGMNCRVLCCKCGVVIQPNASYTCIACLSTEVDITQNIERQSSISFCPKCERYLNPPNQWIRAAAESPQLLSMCMKHVRGLNRGLSARGAKFIWTEPHSKRINIEIVVRGELPTGDLVEQEVAIEFVVHSQQCLDCTKSAAKDFWNACVQVRQRVKHKKTLLNLEQLILRAKAHGECNSIKQLPDGVDFYFSSRAHAISLLNFLCKRAPCRYQTSQHLKSHDANNNTYNYKFTYSVEVAPICKNDTVCLSKALSQKHGGIGPLCIVSKVSEAIHLIDPTTCQVCHVEASAYFASPFTAIANQSQFTSFMVVEIEPEGGKNDCGSTPVTTTGNGRKRTVASSVVGHSLSKKHRLVSVWLMPLDRHNNGQSTQGEDNDLIHTRSHLGYVIHEGDTVYGLDLRNCNINHTEFEDLMLSRNSHKLPDIILVHRPSQPGQDDDGATTITSGYSSRNKRRRNRLGASTSTDGATVDDDQSVAEEDMGDVSSDEDMLQDIVTESEDHGDGEIASDVGIDPQISAS